MLKTLSFLDLSNNQFTGVLTHQHLSSITNLNTPDLSNNFLKIEIDPEWLPPFTLEYAYFASCQMGPLFPAWLQTQTAIVKLDISSASIFDGIPDWFVTTFSSVVEVDISNNRIKGALPTNLHKMASLPILDLSCQHSCSNFTPPKIFSQDLCHQTLEVKTLDISVLRVIILVDLFHHPFDLPVKTTDVIKFGQQSF